MSFVSKLGTADYQRRGQIRGVSPDFDAENPALEMGGPWSETTCPRQGGVHFKDCDESGRGS